MPQNKSHTKKGKTLTLRKEKSPQPQLKNAEPPILQIDIAKDFYVAFPRHFLLLILMPILSSSPQ